MRLDDIPRIVGEGAGTANPQVIHNLNKIIYTLLITDLPRFHRNKGWTEYTSQDRRMIRKKSQRKVKANKRRK